MPEAVKVARGGRLAALLGFLDSDPSNLNLLADAAEAALAENQPAIARDLLARYAAKSPLPERETNLAGLAAMREQDFAAASSLFRELLAQHPRDASLRFNLAWSQVMLKEFGDALELLDTSTVDALPQAAALKLQLLHDQGMFEEAEAFARKAITHHPDHPGLLAATSTLAMDINDVELARLTATRAGAHPEALSTLATLALTDDPRGALDLFSRVLGMTPEAPRALVGKGLALLATGRTSDAVQNLERGAEVFGEHVGSWIAAGWAHVVNGNLDSARVSFEKAVALDRNFGDSQGSLAVIALMTGDVEEGRRLAAIARRLDPKSFSSLLAYALIASSDGRPEVARAIVQRALDAPIADSGQTLAQAIARNALGR